MDVITGMNLRGWCSVTLVALLGCCFVAVPIVHSATPSDAAKTWAEAGEKWNVDLTTTDQLLLCVNFANTAGSISYGRGEDGGADFADISRRFEIELRALHGDETTDLLLSSTMAVMLNTVELIAEPYAYDQWVVANLHRCQDTVRRLGLSVGVVR